MAHIAAASSFVPSIVGLMRYNRLNSAMRLFTVFSVIGVVHIIIEFILGRLEIRNYFLLDIYHIVEVLFMTMIYHVSIPSPSVRKVLKIGAALFITIWFVDKLVFTKPDELNNTLAMITAVFLVVMSIIVLNVYLKTVANKLTEEPLFWILTGTIIYSAGSFAVMGLSNELLKLGVSYFVVGWHINWILFLVSMLMFAKGLLCNSQA